MIGSDATMTIQLSNPGSGAASGVVISERGSARSATRGGQRIGV